MHLKMNTRTLILAVVLIGATAAAQTFPDSAPIFASGAVGMGSLRIDNDDMDATPVKGAPFCASVTTEHTQLFADGNRIHTSDSSTQCRDSAGRTRREASLNLLGAAPQESATRLITIIDPVAGFRYMLDTNTKVARRMPLAPPLGTGGAGVRVMGESGHPPKGEHMVIYQHLDTAGPSISVGDNVFFKKAGRASGEPAPATENLGDQTIEGIHATGTRVTTTIPAGKMGNEQPILVTSERWYSPELKATVMTKHSDPWAGELKTQFTNVNTSEPDPSLFTVPTDYKVVDEKAGPFTIQMRTSAPPAQ